MKEESGGMWFAEEPKVKRIHESELSQVKVARSTWGKGRGRLHGLPTRRLKAAGLRSSREP